MGSGFGVRKHRAPKGALRLCVDDDHRIEVFMVRKHRAPKGALRLVYPCGQPLGNLGQKAPSAKRCIKTGRLVRGIAGGLCVRKHRAPKGALRQIAYKLIAALSKPSESTERQKVH